MVDKIKYSLVLILFCLIEPIYCQSIKVLGEPLQQGEMINVEYSGGTGSPTDWIGIYKSGQVPGNIASTVWQYVPSKSGKISFTGTLPPGKYDIHLFCCDGYNKIASQLSFTIVERIFTSRLKYYKSTDTVTFYVGSQYLNSDLSIYKSKDVKENQPLDESLKVLGLKANPINKITSLDTGQYTAFLIKGNSKLSQNFFIRTAPKKPNNITKIGIGSCGEQDNPQPVLENIITYKPDIFLYLGDNLYIDAYNESTLKSEYERFIHTREEFQNLRSLVYIDATWDDHDYGCCDEDKDYPIKKASQKIFNDFWEIPQNDERRNRDGIYTSYIIGEEGRRLQIILLDARFFLDDRKPNNGCGKNDYCPWTGSGNENKTILGNAQWIWLEEQLKKDADLRLIASSVQFSSSYHGFEAWNLFPHQQKKMLDLIKKTKAKGVFFVSGDMHYSEISKLENPGAYPIYDFTASAINQVWTPEMNTNIVESYSYGKPNIGLIVIDWEEAKIEMKCIDEKNSIPFQHKIDFKEIYFPTSTSQESKKGNLLKNWVQSGDSIELFFNQKMDFLKVFGINGQLIKTYQNVESRLVLENLSSGSYILELKSKKETEKIKIVKI